MTELEEYPAYSTERDSSTADGEIYEVNILTILFYINKHKVHNICNWKTQNMQRNVT
jgi:hypothetical protein